MRIRAEHSIPSTSISVRIRIRRLAKIFENFMNKNGECERSKNTKSFVRAKSIASASTYTVWHLQIKATMKSPNLDIKVL